MNEIKIKLKEDDFQCLVSGGILQLRDNKNKLKISIILTDIGFDRMDHCISQVDNGNIKPYSNLIKDFK